MDLTLAPELERALAEAARQQGTTPELLAVECLRQCPLPAADPVAPAAAEYETLADFLAGYVGVLNSGEHVPGGANLSEQTGRRFAAGMKTRREQGRL